MGKHSAGRQAVPEDRKKRPPRALLWAVPGVVVVAAAAAVLLLTGRAPAEEKVVAAAAAGEEAVLPEEEELHQSGGLQSEEEAPVSAPEEAEEPESRETEEIQITGAAPEDEVPETAEAGESGQWEAGESAAEAEILTQLTAGAGETHQVYVQKNAGSVVVTELLVRDGVVVATAESTYEYVAGREDGEVEGLAQGFTMSSVPPEYAGDAELTWERRGDWLILVTQLRNLDDPARLEAFGDYGLMRIVNGDSYTLAEAEEFLLGLGYEKQ